MKRVTSSCPIRFLYELNPLAKAFAVIPAMMWVIFSRDFATSVGFTLLAFVTLIIGVRMTWRFAILMFVAMPILLALMTLSFGMWVNPELVNTTPMLFSIGPVDIYRGSLVIGLATGARITSVILMAMMSGLTTNGQDLVRSLITQLKVPYRVGYTALAAQRFIPRFAYELELIRSAHRVRGISGGNGPFAKIRRASGYLIPLLASAIRHAERVALAMDSRAFGAHKTRTERTEVPWRIRDTVFCVLYVLASGAIAVWALNVNL